MCCIEYRSFALLLDVPEKNIELSELHSLLICVMKGNELVSVLIVHLASMRAVLFSSRFDYQRLASEECLYCLELVVAQTLQFEPCREFLDVENSRKYLWHLLIVVNFVKTLQV
jgi:hypothetical protein